MDYSNYDKAEQEKRKKDMIAYRNKKRYSSLFMTLASIFEIIETLIIMFILFFISAFFVFKVFGLTNQTGSKIFSALLVVIFIGGLVLGFFVYKKAISWFIKKRNLEDKLLDEVLDHYVRDKKIAKEEKEARMRR